MKFFDYFAPMPLIAPRKPKLPCKVTNIPAVLYVSKKKIPEGYTVVYPRVVRNSSNRAGVLVKGYYGYYLVTREGAREGISQKFAEELLSAK